MEVKFRKATLNDVESIVKLCNECFDENTTIDYAKKIFIETENDSNQIYLIGELEGYIIAHTKITIIPTIFEEMNTYSILNHVCVKEEYRRHNIATKMLEECEKICKEKKCISIKLWSKNFREAAQSCYKNFGFTVEDAGFFEKRIDKE